MILESDDVLGGRTRSTRLQSLPDNAPLLSYGGTWVVLDNDDLISLSEEVRRGEALLHATNRAPTRPVERGERAVVFGGRSEITVGERRTICVSVFGDFSLLARFSFVLLVCWTTLSLASLGSRFHASSLHGLDIRR